MKLSFVSDSYMVMSVRNFESCKSHDSIKPGSLLPCSPLFILPGDKVSIDSDNLIIELSSMPQPDFDGILIEH